MEADFVIVGSGSAGAALAYRLSESGKYSVIIIEAGGGDQSPIIQMPAALSYPMNSSKYDWGYLSEPEPKLNNRRLAVPRGKVVGGSSSINGMVYVRGHAGDYDFWSENGAVGWSYADVLPYFKRMEQWNDCGFGGDPSWRGRSGPMHITRGSRKNELFDVFVRAGNEAGFQLTDDYNGYKQEGFGVMEQTIHKGRRWSSANAYLKPAMNRENLLLVKGVVEKILIESCRADGVLVKIGDKKKEIRARREIIIAASAINSPKLLLHSGIGPAWHLKKFDIDVVSDRPGVGSNLQDHLEVYVQQACIKPITLYKHWNWLSKLIIGAQWLFSKKGLGASNHFESAAFVRSSAGVKYPDIQFHFLPFAIRYDGSLTSQGHGFQAHVGPMRSSSRGTVRLRAKSYTEHPEIRFNYMSNEKDWTDFRRCIAIAREIFSQKPFDNYRGTEIKPGEHCQSVDQINEFIAENAESAYHPCGTCRMGDVNDKMSVVDPECRVIGVDGLRVVDSSIFPRIPNGNINGPSIMVGEKVSDQILGKSPLPRDNSEPWIHPDWQSSDR